MNRTRHAHAADGARARYTGGANCAQAVIGALADTPGVPTLPVSLGAGYTAGIGGSGCVCGALAGGVAVLGEYASGLDLEPIAARRVAEELAASLHARFTERFGSACCRVIKRGQEAGSDEWMARCASLTEETARLVAEIIAEQSLGASGGRWAARDRLSIARRIALGGLAGGAIALLASIAASAAARAGVFSAVLLALTASAVPLELAGPVWRWVGRALRTTGAVAAALCAVAALLVPASAGAALESLLADGPAALVVARAALAACALVVAASAAFALKRYG